MLNFGCLGNSKDCLVEAIVTALNLLVKLLIKLENFGDEENVAVVSGNEHKLMLGTTWLSESG